MCSVFNITGLFYVWKHFFSPRGHWHASHIYMEIETVFNKVEKNSIFVVLFMTAGVLTS